MTDLLPCVSQNETSALLTLHLPHKLWVISCSVTMRILREIGKPARAVLDPGVECSPPSSAETSGSFFPAGRLITPWFTIMLVFYYDPLYPPLHIPHLKQHRLAYCQEYSSHSELFTKTYPLKCGSFNARHSRSFSKRSRGHEQSASIYSQEKRTMRQFQSFLWLTL